MTGTPILLMIATGPVAGVGPDFGAVTGSRLYPGPDPGSWTR